MNFQTALGSSVCTELWLKAGIYKPTDNYDRGISFKIRPGLAVYGGFAGSETNRSARDFSANITTLSGDIGAPKDNSDNSYHVITIDGTTAAGNVLGTTVLDGVTIRDGNADGNSLSTDSGGGLYCIGYGSGNECSPTISNVIFDSNSARFGGAMSADGSGSGAGIGGKSSPVLTQVIFRHNRASNSAGAMYNSGGLHGTSSPILRSVTFYDNSSIYNAGAIYNDGYDGTVSVTLSNVTFTNNTAQSGYGGAMLSDGGTFGSLNVSLTNATFTGNRAPAGGAIWVGVNTVYGSGNVTVRNTILWGNGAGVGAELFDADGVANILHSVVKGGCPAGSSCSNVFTEDPMLEPLRNNGGYTPTVMLGFGSSAIDIGDDAACLPTDQRGVVRPQGPHCDAGSVEVVKDEVIFADGFDSGLDTIFRDGFEL